ncbi:hypothetical protein BCEP4_950006 [Burkholderia cepacia]|nr:hypothetical protein BCEP4_950006 [Burkholderia cepacia]
MVEEAVAGPVRGAFDPDGVGRRDRAPGGIDRHRFNLDDRHAPGRAGAFRRFAARVGAAESDARGDILRAQGLRRPVPRMVQGDRAGMRCVRRLRAGRQGRRACAAGCQRAGERQRRNEWTTEHGAVRPESGMTKRSAPCAPA